MTKNIEPMYYFGNRRPRGFRHTFRFVNERRDILENLKKGLPADTGRLPDLDDCHDERHGGLGMGLLPLAVMLLLLLAATAIYLS